MVRLKADPTAIRRTPRLCPAWSPGAAPHSCTGDQCPDRGEPDESNHDAPEGRRPQHAQQLFTIAMRQQRGDTKANRAHDREDGEKPPRAYLERAARQHEAAQRKRWWEERGQGERDRTSLVQPRLEPLQPAR